MVSIVNSKLFGPSRAVPSIVPFSSNEGRSRTSARLEKDIVSSEDTKIAWAMSKFDNVITRIAQIPARRVDDIHEGCQVHSLV